MVCCVKQSVPHRRTSCVMNVCRNAMRQENLHFILEHQEGNKFYAIFCCSSNVDLFHRKNYSRFYPPGCTNFFYQTRMHSIRMRTGPLQFPSWGCLPRDDVCPVRCLAGGGVSAQGGVHPPPVNRITDRCKSSLPNLQRRAKWEAM